jgi:hypothetical protein
MKKKTNVRGVKPIKPIPDPPPLDQLQGIAKLAATEIAKECACLFAQQSKVVAIIVKHMRPVMDRLGLALVAHLFSSSPRGPRNERPSKNANDAEGKGG